METKLSDTGRCASQLSPNELTQIAEAYEQKEGDTWAFTTTEIARSFNLRYPTTVTQVAHQLGRPTRFELEHGFKKPGNGHRRNGHRVKVDLDAELEAARRKVAELEARRAERAIRFRWVKESTEGDFVTSDESSETLVVYGVTAGFVKAGGMQKLLAFLEQECPQVKLSPNGHVA